MKKIQKERVSYYDVYVANDGTEFNSQEECQKYDNSALGVVRARYEKLVVKTKTEDDILGIGSCEVVVKVLRIKSEEDVNTVMQMFLLENPHLMDNKDRVEKTEKIISLAFTEDDFLVVNHGYDYDAFWVMGTTRQLKEQIDAFVTPDEKKD